MKQVEPSTTLWDREWEVANDAIKELAPWARGLLKQCTLKPTHIDEVALNPLSLAIGNGLAAHHAKANIDLYGGEFILLVVRDTSGEVVLAEHVMSVHQLDAGWVVRDYFGTKSMQALPDCRADLMALLVEAQNVSGPAKPAPGIDIETRSERPQQILQSSSRLKKHRFRCLVSHWGNLDALPELEGVV